MLIELSQVEVGATTTMNMISQDEQDLNQAIEASLNCEMNIDPIEDRPLEDRIKVGETCVISSYNVSRYEMALNQRSPVALCPTHSSYTYASNIIHALYFVPQVRDYIAPWRPLPEDPSLLSEPPRSGPGTGRI